MEKVKLSCKFELGYADMVGVIAQDLWAGGELVKETARYYRDRARLVVQEGGIAALRAGADQWLGRMGDSRETAFARMEVSRLFPDLY